MKVTVVTETHGHGNPPNTNPTSGNEYKVVNWIHAAAIMAQIDPVAAGYLSLDAKGNLRRPALRKLDDIDLADLGQTKRPATRNSCNWSGTAASGRIFITGCVCSRCTCPLYGTGRRTSLCWRDIFCRSIYRSVTTSASRRSNWKASDPNCRPGISPA